MQHLNEALGKRLRLARTAAGLSQQLAADRSGLGMQSLSRYERGLREPPLASLRALAELYGMPLSSLLADASGNFLHSSPELANVRVPEHLPEVPILGYVSAGEPRDEWELNLGLMPVSDRFLRRYPRAFALVVSGDSLSGDGIHDGEILVVDPDAVIEVGKIYIVRLEDGEICARHLIIEEGQVRLQSSNHLYEDLRVTGVQVIGKVVGHFRDFGF